jgi:hypothetical protein
VDKDGEQVKATFDVSVPMGSGFLAYIALSVNGNNLVGDFLPGQTRFNGTRFALLPDPTQDAPVTLSISTNQGWSASDEGTLRGSVKGDVVEFNSD